MRDQTTRSRDQKWLVRIDNQALVSRSGRSGAACNLFLHAQFRHNSPSEHTNVNWTPSISLNLITRDITASNGLSRFKTFTE